MIFWSFINFLWGSLHLHARIFNGVFELNGNELQLEDLWFSAPIFTSSICLIKLNHWIMVLQPSGVNLTIFLSRWCAYVRCLDLQLANCMFGYLGYFLVRLLLIPFIIWKICLFYFQLFIIKMSVNQYVGVHNRTSSDAEFDKWKTKCCLSLPNLIVNCKPNVIPLYVDLF